MTRTWENSWAPSFEGAFFQTHQGEIYSVIGPENPEADVYANPDEFKVLCQTYTQDGNKKNKIISRSLKQISLEDQAVYWHSKDVTIGY